MDDVKKLTGWKAVAQFVYRVGLLFLHSEHSGWDGGPREEQRNLRLKTANNNKAQLFCALTPKVHLSTCNLGLGLPAPGQPVSHIQNQVTVLALRVDAVLCCETRALTPVCL